MHSTERTRPEPTESEKKENKPNAAKILQAEKLDVSQQTKNKCRRKTRFLETNQKNLAKENESGMPFILYIVLFSVLSFHFSYFPARNVFISLEYIIGISYWARKQYWQKIMKMKILRRLYQVGNLGSGVLVSQAVIMIESGVCFRCMCEDFHWVHIWVPYGSLQFHIGQQEKVCASVLCLQVTQAFTLSAGKPGANNACEGSR